jgi:SM-20-related protein
MNVTDWPNLFVVKHFFEPRVCDAIVGEMKTTKASAATVYGKGNSGSVDANVRNTLRVVPSSETVDLVTQRLLSCKQAVEEHFSLTLDECEDPQFLRYREGDFFVAHQDGNTGMLRLDTERRRISTVIFLNRIFRRRACVHESYFQTSNAR